MRSGIYARFGAENKDVITEATAQEFKDWLAIRGLNISFMSDDTLNGFFTERQEPFRQWEIRTAFIRDAEANGITVYKVRDDWEAFKAAYQEEAQRRYGFSANCTICGKGEVVEKEEKNHKTMVLGQELTIPEAIVGRCDTCGAVNYAFRKDVWLKAKDGKGNN